MKDGKSATRLRESSHALAIIARLNSDEDFNERFAQAIDTGEARVLGEMLKDMGVREVALRQGDRGTVLTFNAGIVICITITIQACWNS